jgi:hypothetical protein
VTLALATARLAARREDPSLSAGYLAVLPLLVAYELGLAALPGEAGRASAERVLTLALAPLGERLRWARIAILGGLALLALGRLARAGKRGPERWRLLGRLACVGGVAGVLLAPLLILLQGWLGAGPLASAREPARDLPSTLRLLGAAPWEELLFRVGLYGGLYLVVQRAGRFLGLESRLSRLGAEWAALLGSALLFACFHLEAVQALLGTTGEAFHRGLFLWRVSAGILLAGLFRWRGLGAAAWAHAVFNLGVALGIRA